MQYDYDLLVIGSGPAGQRAAIQAAKFGKRVCMAEKNADIGGAQINTGTIPSKTLREAVIFLSGYRQRNVYGASFSVKQNITMDDLVFRTGHVMRHELDVTQHQILRNRVELVKAAASFVDPHTVRLQYNDGRSFRDVTAGSILIAVGTRPALGEGIPFDGKRVITSDEILSMKELPRTLAIIGGGVIGCEYATIFATLGVRVTLVDKRHRLLRFIDTEITDALHYLMQQNRVTMRLGESVAEIEHITDPRNERERVRMRLESGKELVTDAVLYSVGRTGNTADLNLESVGVEADNRLQVTVNENYQTTVPHIYAAGDVIGFPSLASTSMEQGRIVTCHAFGQPCHTMPSLFPYGIYTIPEISTVGRNEEELTNDNIPYEIGKASYREIARGQIIGDETGMLKLMFHTETRELLGVHIIGEGASELIHIGQAVLGHKGTVDYLIDAVFNYPTLAECYKVAALDAVNRML